jgi:L-malate glycosyltransferase
MRVLHIDTGREWRGGQTQLLHLLREASTPTGVVLAPDAPLRDAVDRAFCADFRSPFRAPSGLREAIDSFRPDVIAAHTSHAHGHAVRVARCPVVVHRRVDFRVRRRSRRKYARAQGYVAVSHAVSRVLQAGGVPEERIDVVHDGVAPTEGTAQRTRLLTTLGLPADAVLVLAVGALVPHKGHLTLRNAMEELPDRFHCLIAGTGPLGVSLDGHPRVHLLGHRSDIGTLLRSCDVFCHPSIEEGMGQVIVEALMAPIRVVATTAGGIPEVVGSDGVLVAPGCAVSLAVGILDARARALHDPARVMGAFEVGRMVRGTEAAYRRFVNAR